MQNNNERTANILGSLVGTLELQHSQKRDRVISGSGLIYQDGHLWVPSKPNLTGQRPTEICHAQIAEKLGIPAAYYRRMMSENQSLHEANINSWLKHDQKAKFLLRCFEMSPDVSGIARAFLSDRYHMIDNLDVLLAALEAIKMAGVEVDIVKADVTDSRMYLHVTCPKVEVEAEAFLKGYMKENDAVGNGIVSGLVLTNSEVGKGTFEIRPRAVIVKCNNGLMTKDDRFRRVHLGGRMDEGNIEWSEATQRKNRELVVSQTKDAIRTFMSKDYLGVMIRKIAEAHEIKLENGMDTVQNVCRELSITEEHKRSILEFFLRDGDHRASGVFHAITRQAQAMTPDVQFEVEAGAAEILPNIKRFDKPFSKN